MAPKKVALSERTLDCLHARRMYAVCGNGIHLRKAFEFMTGAEMKVYAAGEGYGTCHCGAPAKWLMREVGYDKADQRFIRDAVLDAEMRAVDFTDEAERDDGWTPEQCADYIAGWRNIRQRMEREWDL